MRQLARLLIAIAAGFVAFSSHAEPATAIGQARQAINARDYGAASEGAGGNGTGIRSGTAVETGGTMDARARAAATVMAGRAAAQPDATPVPKGQVERWVYSRDPLSSRIPDDQLLLKFITEEGYGENVLQRDPLVVKALHDAAPARH